MDTKKYNELIETIKTHAKNEIRQSLKICYSKSSFDYGSWALLSELGFWKIAVPTKLGGLDGTWVDFANALSEIAKNSEDLGFCLSIVAQAGLIRTLSMYGTPIQTEKYLSPLLEGKIGATALTEMRSGSDVARVETSAEQISKDKYLLNGKKNHITHGTIADIALILGRIQNLGQRDITTFIVDMNDKHIVKGMSEEMPGNKSSPTGPFHIENYPAGKDNLIGKPGYGLEIIYNTISLDRALYGIIGYSYLEPILEELLNYAKQRKAFHKEIFQHQYIQKRLVDLKMNIELTKSISFKALHSIGGNSYDASLLASIAKLIGTESLKYGTEQILRIKGHKGYTDPQSISKILDALGTIIAGGTIEMQYKNIFNRLIQKES